MVSCLTAREVALSLFRVMKEKSEPSNKKALGTSNRMLQKRSYHFAVIILCG